VFTHSVGHDERLEEGNKWSERTRDAGDVLPRLAFLWRNLKDVTQKCGGSVVGGLQSVEYICWKVEKRRQGRVGMTGQAG